MKFQEVRDRCMLSMACISDNRRLYILRGLYLKLNIFSSTFIGIESQGYIDRQANVAITI